MRIVRCVVDDEPTFGVVEGEAGQELVTLVTGDPLFTPTKPTGARVPLADVRLLAPVIPRSKVVGLGRTYPAHAAERGVQTPSDPIVFVKPNTTVVGPGDPVVLPAYSKEVHCEGELAVVIGRVGKDVPVERAAELIVGFTCANDVSARDCQREDPTWARAKAFDTSCPLGPWIETDFDLRSWQLETTVDGKQVQSATGADMAASVPELVAYASTIFTLLPGDVVLTGTPAGTAEVTAGQEMSVAITGLGELRNPVVRRETGE